MARILESCLMRGQSSRKSARKFLLCQSSVLADEGSKRVKMKEVSYFLKKE